MLFFASGDLDLQTRLSETKHIFRVSLTQIHSAVPKVFHTQTRMWANAQPDGCPAEHRWRPLFNAAKFG